MNRFAAFTDDELIFLWHETTYDDGVQYGVADDDPFRPLLVELHEEAMRRGAANPMWENVL